MITDFVFIPLLKGDYDGSGEVGEADFEMWRDSFGDAVAPFSGADGNGNGIDRRGRLHRVARQFGGDLERSVPVRPCVVPEPTTACLTAAMLASWPFLDAVPIARNRIRTSRTLCTAHGALTGVGVAGSRRFFRRLPVLPSFR